MRIGLGAGIQVLKQPHFNRTKLYVDELHKNKFHPYLVSVDVSLARAATTAPTPYRFFASKHASQDGPHGIGEGAVGELSRETEDRGHGNVLLHGIA